MSEERLKLIREEIKILEDEQRSIYKASLEAPEDEKVCDDFIAEQLARPMFGGKMQYPIEVNGINFAGGLGFSFLKDKCPQLVAVRPVGDKKTYLGVYLGDIPLSVSCSLHRETGVLSISNGMSNPAIAVPALGKIVMGAGSWWSAIETEEQLRQITDEDIDNIWYVKVLQGLNPKLKAQK